jgi:hypothetical protein
MPAPPAIPPPPTAVAASAASLHGDPAPSPSAQQAAEAETLRGGMATGCRDGGGNAGRLLPGLADIGASWALGAGRSLGWNRPSSDRQNPGGGSRFPPDGGVGAGLFLGCDRWTPPSAGAGAGIFGGSLLDGGIGGGIAGGLASPAGQQDLGSILCHRSRGSVSAFERRGSGGDGRGGMMVEDGGGGGGAGDGYGSAQSFRQQVGGPHELYFGAV